MAEERVQRRLAAILAADVVGYSRLMDADEAGTLSRLKAIRAEIFDPKTEAFGGRVFKNTGDGAIAEFASSVDAVQCAVDIQRALAERDVETPEDQRLILRIGISQGDVIVDGDDLFGNGVNVAARMEGLAEPGGICISGNVREHVGNSLEVALEDLGDQTVKNIDRPVRCYRVQLESDRTTDQQAPPLSDKPSIAVLPFVNMSGDPEQEYFSDGITEDLITALSRIHWFFVTARNSVFSYKGTSPDVRHVAVELGVRYVLEGGVRKSGKRVRITAQLINGATGNHVWAERYDRDLGDVFDLQDEMTEKIVGAIEPAITKSEFQRSLAKRPDSLDAWDLCQRGWWHRYRLHREDMLEARDFFERAIKADPGFGSSYAGLSEALSYELIFSYVDDVQPHAKRAVSLARRAVEIDDEDPVAYVALGRAYMASGELVSSIGALRKALQLNPYFAAAHYTMGHAYILTGQLQDGIDSIRKAMVLSPQDIWMGPFHARLAQAYLAKKDYARAKEHAEEAFRCSTPPNWPGKSYLVSALGHLGHKEEAARALEELLQMRPELSISWINALPSSFPPMGRDHMSDYLDGLRKAGLPE